MSIETTTQRFIINPETVIDTITGLEWTREDVSPKDLTWKQAEAACKACRVNGHNDWRLPTRTELFGLTDDTRHNPAIDTDAFPTCKSDWYWTSTELNASPAACAWLVGFNYGAAGNDRRSSRARVRAVRASSR